MSKRTLVDKTADTSSSPITPTPSVVLDKPVLTDATGLGGVNAQTGFDYQNWNALSRLPVWLRSQAFEGFALEALEDFEARFFAPHSPARHVLDRYQAKSGDMPKGEIQKVFKSFHAFEHHHPNVARWQTLVTPGLPSTLKWLSRDLQRVRDVRPLYRPFPNIIKDSDEKLTTDLSAEFGQELGTFVSSKVDVATDFLADRQQARAHFVGGMCDAFPEVQVTAQRWNEVFDKLCVLANNVRGKLITRQELLAVIENSLGSSLSLPSDLQLHCLSDRTARETAAIELDGSRFSGAALGVVDPSVWHDQLSAPAEATAQWAYKQGYRRVALTGQFRLTTAFVLGSAFRSAHGYEIDIPAKGGKWSTDNHPRPDSRPLRLDVFSPKRAEKGRLALAIGVMKDPSSAVVRFLGDGAQDWTLLINIPDAVPDGHTAQQLVQQVRSIITSEVSRLAVLGVDLFYVGPVALAVAIGHRWNALPPTQLHEYSQQSQTYSPSAAI